jgi:glycerol-3-phosphate dehydrogenase
VAGFEPTSRAQSLARIADGAFDVLVIGGGITGAGVAREAALRGLTTALVEARDFASGTSSRSSKLIHGGLRYLEQGDIALVREAATERKVLRWIAPHLTVPAPMLVPVYGRTSAGVYKLRVGLSLYDRLAGVPVSERHRILSRDETVEIEPALDRERLQGAGLYPEYVTDDARLVLDTLKAAHHAGALVVNHTRVDALGACDGVRRAGLHDQEGDARLSVRARVVVNAAGPWVDAVRALDHADERPTLHLTKGVHLVFRPGDLPVHHCVVMRAADGRAVFTVPRATDVYVGTTDTSYVGPLEEPAVAREDASYLFATLARTFPGLRLGAEQVVGAWAGLRPLVAEPGKSPSEISRKDEIVVAPSGLVTIAGGKLTTYRRMAERVLETCAEVLGRPLPRVDTAAPPLPGGELGEARDIASYASSPAVRAGLEGVPTDVAGRLLKTHGSDALEVVACADGPTDLMPIVPDVALTVAEVRHAVRREMACSLADVLERRTRVALFATAAARAAAPPVADVVAGELGWSADRRARELDEFTRRCDARLAWRDGAVPLHHP